MAARRTTPRKPASKSAPRTKLAASSWSLERVLDASQRAKLTPVRLEQLAVLATFYDGLRTTPATIPPGLFSKHVTLSKVLEGGRHRYDLWMIGSDEGCVFWKGDREPVGVEAIQGGFGDYPKKGWVVRGLALDLARLAWELNHLDGPEPPHVVPVPRPAPSKPTPFAWKPLRDRRTPDDCAP